MGNHGGGLFHRIILAKGNKVNVFHVEQQADVLKVDAKGIVGGYGYHQRPAVSQMCFCSHKDRSVRDSVGQFGQGVAGAGSDEEDIQVPLWTNGFGLLDFQYWLHFRDGCDSVHKLAGIPETGVRGLDASREDGVQDGPCLLQMPDFLFYFCKGAKRPGDGQAYMFSF